MMENGEKQICTAKWFDTEGLKNGQESMTLCQITSKELLDIMLYNILDSGDYDVSQDNPSLVKANKHFEKILKQWLPLPETLLQSIFEGFAHTNQKIMSNVVYKGTHAFKKFKYFFINHIRHLESTGVELSQSQIRTLLTRAIMYTLLKKEITAENIVQEGMAFEIPYEDYIDDLLLESNNIVSLYEKRKNIPIDQYLKKEEIDNELFDLQDKYDSDLQTLEEYFLITYKDNWKQLLTIRDSTEKWEIINFNKESEIINSIVINFDELIDITHAIEIFESMNWPNGV